MSKEFGEAMSKVTLQFILMQKLIDFLHQSGIWSNCVPVLEVCSDGSGDINLGERHGFLQIEEIRKLDEWCRDHKARVFMRPVILPDKEPGTHITISLLGERKMAKKLLFIADGITEEDGIQANGCYGLKPSSQVSRNRNPRYRRCDPWKGIDTI